MSNDVETKDYYVTPEQIATIPLSILREFETEAVESPWRVLDEERAKALKTRKWSPIFFADFKTYSETIKRSFIDNAFDPQLTVTKMVDIAVLGPWRITRGLYVFDEALSTALADTNPAEEIPVDVLLRLPEWSVCIFGEGLGPDASIICAFASWFYADESQVPWLNIILVPRSGSRLSVTIQLENHTTIASAVARALAQTLEAQELNPDYDDLAEKQPIITENVSRTLAHILYLCAAEPDMDTAPKRPEPQKTRSGPRFFAPDKPHIIQVGARFGAMFRRTRAEFATAESSAKTGRTMPPHWRKAHWHSFFTGPRKPNKPELQTRIVKWIAPTFVNATPEQTPVVIREVLSS